MTLSTDLFDDIESNVRSYCRKFPVVFERAQGHELVDTNGNRYVDFMSGAGALNYGHNHPDIQDAVVEYLGSGGPVHSLDLHTVAKARFLNAFRETALSALSSTYRVQFTGPTGANAVEAALKTARRYTGRSGIVAFTNGFHGGSLGALATSSNAAKRAAAGVDLPGVTHVPYCALGDRSVDTLSRLEDALDDPGSGVAKPAAVILETVQGEGGLGTASPEWLRRLEKILRERDILMIVDDIQAGCGRTGRFFSFEEFGLEPDIICLAKSISGLGLPMALTLIREEVDVLEPGAHAGTFRGNNLAFAGAEAALGLWAREGFAASVAARITQLDARLADWAEWYEVLEAEPVGRGMFRGLRFRSPERAGSLAAEAYRRGLLAETSGARGQTFKIMPPITIEPTALDAGLDLIEEGLCALGRDT